MDVKPTPERPKNICFGCKKPGHWIRQCPEKAKQSPRSADSGNGDASVPEKRCPCGGGVCVVLISKTERNPNRKFYRCPVTTPGMKCDFFQWCDSPSSSRPSLSLDFSLYPMCACGAGKAVLSVACEGINAGRRCFICPIKKGQGACNFLQCVDDLMKEKERSITPLEPNKWVDSSSSKTGTLHGSNMNPSSQMTGSEPGMGIVLGKQGEAAHSVVARRLIFEENVAGPERIRVGNCYGCGKPGHWMENCPSHI